MTASRCLGKNGKPCFEVWRQDDNGNQFFITAFEDEAQAEARVKELTERGHKQTYWVQRCKHKRVQLRHQ